MKIPKTMTAGFVCLLVLLSLGLSAQNPVIAVQGILKDANGAAVDDGTQSLTFSLYRTITDGIKLWSEVAPVTVVGGLYSHSLGSISPFSGSTGGADAIFRTPVYLGVEVDGLELSPRTQMTYAPYAILVNSAQEIVRGGCSGQVGDIKYSILPPGKFAERNGSCWVRMDGRDISNTDLATLMDITNVPNMSGKFLRATEYNDDDGDNDPGRDHLATTTTQLSDNKRHGHTLSDGGPHRHEYKDSYLFGFRTYDIEAERTGITLSRDGTSFAVRSAPLNSLNSDIYTANNFSSSFTNTLSDQETSESSQSHNHTVSESGGDARPINMNFFLYIRVD